MTHRTSRREGQTKLSSSPIKLVPSQINSLCSGIYIQVVLTFLPHTKWVHKLDNVHGRRDTLLKEIDKFTEAFQT